MDSIMKKQNIIDFTPEEVLQKNVMSNLNKKGFASNVRLHANLEGGIGGSQGRIEYFDTQEPNNKVEDPFNELEGRRFCEALDEWRHKLNHKLKEQKIEKELNIKQIARSQLTTNSQRLIVFNSKGGVVTQLQKNIQNLNKLDGDKHQPRLNQMITNSVMKEDLLDDDFGSMNQQENNSSNNNQIHNSLSAGKIGLGGSDNEQNSSNPNNLSKGNMKRFQSSKNFSHHKSSAAMIINSQSPSYIPMDFKNFVNPDGITKTSLQIKTEANVKIMNDIFYKKLNHQLDEFDKEQADLNNRIYHLDENQLQNKNNSMDQHDKTPEYDSECEQVIDENQEMEVNQQQINNNGNPSSAATSSRGSLKNLLSNKTKIKKIMLFRQKAYNVINDETNKFSKTTMANFKSLLAFNKNPQKCISLSDTLNRIMEDRNLMSNDKLKNELKLLQKQKDYFRAVELSILEMFNQVEKNYLEKKALLLKLRMDHSQQQQKLKSVKVEFRSLLNQYRSELLKLESAQAQQELKQASVLRKGTNKQKTVIILKADPYEKKIGQLKTTFSNRQLYFQKHLEKLQDDFTRIQKMSLQTQQEVSALKDQRSEYQYMLREHYINMLKNDESVSDKSLVWIIKALWRIGEEAYSTIFPKYLDTNNIQFLMKLAKLESKKDQIAINYNDDIEGTSNNAVNSSNYDNELNNKQKRTNSLEQNQKLQQYLHLGTDQILSAGREEVNRKKQELLQMSESKVKKPIFMEDKVKQHHIVKWEESPHQPKQVVKKSGISRNNSLAASEDVQAVDPNNSHYNNNNQESNNQTDSVNYQINLINQQIKELKRAEFERIFKLRNQDNEDTFDGIKKVFQALYGSQEANYWMTEFIRQREELLKKIEKNKTFTFKQAVFGQGKQFGETKIDPVTLKAQELMHQQNNQKNQQGEQYYNSQFLSDRKKNVQNYNKNKSNNNRSLPPEVLNKFQIISEAIMQNEQHNQQQQQINLTVGINNNQASSNKFNTFRSSNNSFHSNKNEQQILFTQRPATNCNSRKTLSCYNNFSCNNTGSSNNNPYIDMFTLFTHYPENKVPNTINNQKQQKVQQIDKLNQMLIQNQPTDQKLNNLHQSNQKELNKDQNNYRFN